MPNVGKSTMYNTLTKCSIPAENYPFCTVMPLLPLCLSMRPSNLPNASLATRERARPPTWAARPRLPSP